MNVKLLRSTCACLLACLMAVPALLPMQEAMPVAPVCAAKEEPDYTELKGGALTFHKTAYAAEVVKCNAKAESVEIPEKIDGVPVVSIGENAFRKCALSTVTIPDSVEIIASGAFGECPNLNNVSIPGSVMHIEKAAFRNCKALETVTLQEGLSSIEDEAFAGSALQFIGIPASVSAFGTKIFDGTPYWEALTAEQPLVVCNSILIDGRTAGGEAVIPDGVTTIVPYAFEGNGKLTALTIPESVQTIGMDAFAGCTALTEVRLPDGLIEMEIGILSGCTKLESVTIPESVTVIRSGVFAGCSSLTEVHFPDHQIDIYSKSFEDTPWLAAMQEQNPLVIVNGTLLDGQACTGDVVIPDGVTIIASRAFDDNPDITSVSIPAGVAEIWDNTFHACTGLETVVMKGSKYIANGAFSECSALKKLILSNSVQDVDEDAFQGVTEPLSVTFFGTKAQWEDIEIAKGNAPLESAKVTFTLAGDADNDGKLTVTDVVAFQKWLLCIPDAGLENADAADLNFDGVTDVYDLALMKHSLLMEQE